MAEGGSQTPGFDSTPAAAPAPSTPLPSLQQRNPEKMTAAASVCTLESDLCLNLGSAGYDLRDVGWSFLRVGPRTSGIRIIWELAKKCKFSGSIWDRWISSAEEGDGISVFNEPSGWLQWTVRFENQWSRPRHCLAFQLSQWQLWFRALRRIGTVNEYKTSDTW